MNVSEDKLFEDIQQSARDSSEAVTIAKSTKQAVEKGFDELKASFRYDVQSIVNNDVKLAIYEALEKHHNDKVIPLFRENIKYCEDENQKIHARLSKPEAVANFLTSVWTFLIGIPVIGTILVAAKELLGR